LPLVLFARGDVVRSAQQGDPTLPADANDQAALTLGGRWALWLGPWGSVAAHVELSASTVTGDDGSDQRSLFFAAGFDAAL
jgi:hypothetical protein